MTPAHAIDLVRSHRALVTMRMHPALIAAGSGVPWALVVADDRLHAFDEPVFQNRIARDSEPDRIHAAVRGALAVDGSAEAVHAELAPLRDRLAVTRTALEEFVRTAAPGARTISTVTRLHHVAQRATSALGIAARGAAGVLPRRAIGAVQGPVSTRPGNRTVWGWARAARPDRHGARDPGWSTRRPGNPRSAASRRRGRVRAGRRRARGLVGECAVRAAARPLHRRRDRSNSHGELLPLSLLGVTVDCDIVGELRSPPSGYEVVPGPLPRDGGRAARCADRLRRDRGGRGVARTRPAVQPRRRHRRPRPCAERLRTRRRHRTGTSRRHGRRDRQRGHRRRSGRTGATSSTLHVVGRSVPANKPLRRPCLDPRG